MENFEIQNHLGEVLTIVTQEELTALIELGENQYAQYDATPENDMVTRLAAGKAEDPDLDITIFRIYKLVVE